MLNLVLRRALDPDMLGEAECALCGVRFEVDSVYVMARGYSSAPVCLSCVDYFGAMIPNVPSIEDYEAALKQYPAPVFLSVEEAYRVSEDAEAFAEAYAKSCLS
jgi:hypothetical protein